MTDGADEDGTAIDRSDTRVLTVHASDTEEITVYSLEFKQSSRELPEELQRVRELRECSEQLVPVLAPYRQVTDSDGRVNTLYLHEAVKVFLEDSQVEPTLKKLRDEGVMLHDVRGGLQRTGRIYLAELRHRHVVTSSAYLQLVWQAVDRIRRHLQVIEKRRGYFQVDVPRGRGVEIIDLESGGEDNQENHGGASASSGAGRVLRPERSYTPTVPDEDDDSQDVPQASQASRDVAQSHHHSRDRSGFPGARSFAASAGFEFTILHGMFRVQVPTSDSTVHTQSTSQVRPGGIQPRKRPRLTDSFENLDKPQSHAEGSLSQSLPSLGFSSLDLNSTGEFPEDDSPGLPQG